MPTPLTTVRKIGLPLLFLVALLGGYWLSPIDGQIVVALGGSAPSSLWPQMRVDPPTSYPGQPVTIQVTDNVPWANVRLTVAGKSIQVKDWWSNPGGTWTWQWVIAAPDAQATTLVFYHSCQSGCVKRGTAVLGTNLPQLAVNATPTKLGVVFADPKRDWHGRSGWDVELTYARMAEREYWGVDDLAERVGQATANGLRVLVRVDYAQGQSLPPRNDYVALGEYLDYLRRLARDDRLRDVYGYFIGSSFNELASNSASPDRPVTPEWYARLFNGYGEAPSRTDNVVQVMRNENRQAEILVGPIRPWSQEQNGALRFSIDVPWLNYMNTLVADLDEGARSKAASGVPFVAPDGFAVQAPGRPDAPELSGQPASEEPRTDVHRQGWGDSEAGFRVYRDWLAIVNSYPSTRGLPLYITSTNTFAPDDNVPPAQNYPPGWLTAALGEINSQPQIRALCWFVDSDLSGDPEWNWFSLFKHPGQLADASAEFDLLLQR
ncbi:MAG: hypothetical protein M1570_16470 [Chloroflexi bacterium]|nr:hypothetical protein [Chloroflexota bacterium]